MMPAPAPMRRYPHRAWMRTCRPVPTHPHPASAPFPATGHPKPYIHRSGGRRDDFHLWRRRRRSRLFHHYLIRRRRGAVPINHFTFHAARQQRQACPNQSTVNKECTFHIHPLRRRPGRNVSSFGLPGVLHPLEQKYQRHTCEGQHAKYKEIVHIRPQTRLLVQQRINHSIRLLRCRHRVRIV